MKEASDFVSDLLDNTKGQAEKRYSELLPAFRFFVFFAVPDLDELSKGGIGFSEVKGIGSQIQTEDISEGGGNNYTIRLPKPPVMKNLVLRKAMTAVPSGVIEWAVDAVENFRFETRTVIVVIKDEKDRPVKAWNFESAYPVKLEISELGAQKNEIIIETMELAYKRYSSLNLNIWQ